MPFALAFKRFLSGVFEKRARCRGWIRRGYLGLLGVGMLAGIVSDASARQRPTPANDLSDAALLKNLGVVFEHEKMSSKNPLESRCGAGMRVQYKDNVWLFMPLSFLSRPELPFFYFLDGEQVDVSKLPVAFFGDRNLVAFYMGTLADWRASHPGKTEPLKIAESLDEGNAIPSFLVVQDKDLTPHLFRCEVRVDKERMGRLALARGADAAYRGAALFSQETGLLYGMLIGQSVEDDRPVKDILDFTRLPEPLPVPWTDIVCQREKFLNLSVRTASLFALCNPNADAVDVKDSEIRSLSRSYGKKLKDAAQRKTESMRDTTAARAKFCERLADALESDTGTKGYTLPCYAAAAVEHAKLRKECIERVRKNNVNEEIILKLAE